MGNLLFKGILGRLDSALSGLYRVESFPKGGWAEV